MPTAEAHVPTDRPSRYLVQLCRHAKQMGRMRHRPPTRHSGGQMPPEVRHVGYSETYGIVRFAEGQWTLQATAGTLTLRVEATDENTLRRLQDGIAARLEKIGRHDQLAVTWQRPQASAALGEQAPGMAPAPQTGAGKRRRHGRLDTIALVAGGALVVAVHLGLGGAALAASAWTSWATNIVLAIILLKLITIAGHVMLGRFAIRRGKIVHARWKLRHSPPEPAPTAAPPMTEQAAGIVKQEEHS
jgi:hypothetical protein